MALRTDLTTFIGNARAVEILRRAIQQDRLPHAMIFAGPSGVGKCTLALLVAQYLNCLSPNPEGPCDSCSPCRRIRAILDSRHTQCLTLKEGKCGTCANCKIRASGHPDVRLVEPEKTTIGIGQVRDLIGEIAFQPAEARYRVVILDPAEQMRAEAQNSLLKTLEEPASRTVIILIATNPYLLLETIRSRSRMLQFGDIPQNRMESYLVESARMSKDEARLAAALSGGSLAAALSFNGREYREIRSQALEFVTLLLKRGSFARASGIAGQVAKDKDKDFFQAWLASAAALLQDIYFAGFSLERVGQYDLLDKLSELAGAVPRSILVRANRAVAKLNRDLQQNVNRQLALEAMFVSLQRAK